MTTRPILFSGPMVRALQDGTKTQTRRIVKPQPAPDQQPRTVIGSSGFVYVMDNAPLLPYPEVRRVRWDCPYGQPGDRLWVRETWKPHSSFAGMKPRDMPESEVFYRADDAYAPSNTPWVPAIHMPRWASRITLEITGVRVERLQDISEADARAEGARECDPVSGREVLLAGPSQRGSFVLHYRDIWEQINGPGSWDANPWIWAVEFKKLEATCN